MDVNPHTIDRIEFKIYESRKAKNINCFLFINENLNEVLFSRELETCQ
jgi:hypothetical protein